MTSDRNTISNSVHSPLPKKRPYYGTVVQEVELTSQRIALAFLYLCCKRVVCCFFSRGMWGGGSMCERIVWQFVCDLCENGVWLCSMQRSFENGANTVALSLIATGLIFPSILYQVQNSLDTLLLPRKGSIFYTTVQIDSFFRAVQNFSILARVCTFIKGRTLSAGMWMCVCCCSPLCGYIASNPGRTRPLYFTALSLSSLPFPHSRNIRNGARKHRQLGFPNTYFLFQIEK